MKTWAKCTDYLLVSSATQVRIKTPENGSVITLQVSIFFLLSVYEKDLINVEHNICEDHLFLLILVVA